MFRSMLREHHKDGNLILLPQSEEVTQFEPTTKPREEVISKELFKEELDENNTSSPTKNK